MHHGGLWAIHIKLQEPCGGGTTAGDWLIAMMSALAYSSGRVHVFFASIADI
jgi:hypothetical protein